MTTVDLIERSLTSAKPDYTTRAQRALFWLFGFECLGFWTCIFRRVQNYLDTAEVRAILIVWCPRFTQGTSFYLLVSDAELNQTGFHCLRAAATEFKVVWGSSNAICVTN